MIILKIIDIVNYPFNYVYYIKYMSKEIDNKKTFDVNFNKETNNKLLEDNNLIVDTNESLMAMEMASFDQTLEIMSKTLAKIDAKMDVENSQSKKLDQLPEIKKQLTRLENTRETNAVVYPESTVITVGKNETDEKINQSRIPHNHYEISELLKKMQKLEDKMLTIEDQSNNSNKRFTKLEGTVRRFEDLEIKIPILLKNIFQKKEKAENYKNDAVEEPLIMSEVTKTLTSKDEANIFKEIKSNSKNATDETIINENYDSKLSEEVEIPKKINFQHKLKMFLLLFAITIILFFIDKFQIIDLNFNKVSNSVNSLFDLLRM